MSSWQKIRKFFCEGTKPGTTGEIIALRKAVKLFMRIKDNFIDKILATDSFNADGNLRVALLSQDIADLHESLTGEKI